MKIVVFGAPGGTGRQVVEQALEAGYQVTAFVRNPGKLGIENASLSEFQGDVMEATKVEQAIEGQEAVISTLGPTRPPVPAMMETAAENIVNAMQKHGLRRLISTTGGGVRAPQDQPKLFDHLMKGLLSLMAGAILRESEANVEIIRNSDLNWTIVRFPHLVEGSHTRIYRVGYVGKNSGSQISRADGADFILKELENGNYFHQMPIVIY